MRWGVWAAAWIAAAVGGSVHAASPAGRAAGPIIDVHLHALSANDQGPPPVVICAPYDDMPVADTRWDGATYAAKTFKTPICKHPIWSAKDDDALREETLAALRKYDITAVTSGDADKVERWRREEPRRIVPAIGLGLPDASTIPMLRALHKAGRLAVIGEIAAQYEGAAPNDPRLEPYWALAEELDIPAALHVGPGPPGAVTLGIKTFRMAAGDPLLLEEVLVKHPKLRLYVMHAGWPNADRMIALMYAFPQVCVDTGVIDYTQPRPEFHAYLKRLVEAGYGKRIMFGSDQMVWPGAMGPAIEAITSAPFLTPAQKRDILHDNAARFLRLDEGARPSP